MARLIDADKAENQIQKLIVQMRTDPNDRIERLMESAFKICLDIVREASTIDPESLRPEWISVKDRLPEKTKTC